jgi:hypothetical protein
MIVKSVEDLERLWNVSRSNEKYITVSENELPEEVKTLKPYIDFFCVEHQSCREAFLQSLPQKCFVDLHNTLTNVKQYFLRDWLADDDNFTLHRRVWSALVTLDQIPGEYLD